MHDNDNDPVKNNLTKNGSVCWMKRSICLLKKDQFTRNYGSVVVATVAAACGGS